MLKVTVKSKGETTIHEYSYPVLAADVLSHSGLYQPKPCGGKGKCGKCKISFNGREVLACQTYIKDDAVIEYTPQNETVKGISDGIIREFEKEPLISCGYGAAIDIGTTTVAGYIYKFPECTLVKSLCLPNPQAEFGADVISRIDFWKRGGGDRLSKCIADTVKEITNGFGISKYVICGNTAMMYLLTGKDPSELGAAPYHAKHLFGKWYENAYLVRCSSAFVGGDITAAVLSSGMTEQETSLLIDIGTNGEMVLKHKDKIFCCSTAAGPCFEGAGIACGVPAVTGAINRVISGDKMLFTTIGEVPPVGICGTGLVDAVAALLRMGIIDESGYMDKNMYFPNSCVYLSPEDVRNFQLAKSAIRSGIDTLLHESGVKFNDIDRLYIAGGFGGFMRIESAVKTGIIPAELAGRTVVTGNSAGVGASMILQSKRMLEFSEQIMQSAGTVSLSDNLYFMDKYIHNMEFNI